MLFERNHIKWSGFCRIIYIISLGVSEINKNNVFFHIDFVIFTQRINRTRLVPLANIAWLLDQYKRKNHLLIYKVIWANRNPKVKTESRITLSGKGNVTYLYRVCISKTSGSNVLLYTRLTMWRQTGFYRVFSLKMFE